MKLFSPLLSIAILGLSGLCGSWFFFPITTQEISIASGNSIFQKKCNGCHGVDPLETRLGPSLAKIGSDSENRKTDQNAEEYLLESILNPEAFLATDGVMPAGLADDLSDYDLLSLVAFLSTLGGNPDYEAIKELDLSNRTAADKLESEDKVTIASIEEGRTLFYDKLQCSICHDIEPRPNSHLKAPTLRGIGYQETSALRDSIRNASEHINPSFRQRLLVCDSGEIVQGRIIHETSDTFTVLVVNSTGGFSLSYIPKDEVVTSKDVLESTMPNWNNDSLSEQDLQSLIIFLKTLR